MHVPRIAAAGWSLTGLLLLPGCAAERDPGPPAAAAAPHVQILAPADGDTVSVPFTVRLATVGVEVVPASGLREEGQGHHHLIIGPDLSPADLPIPSDSGFFHIGTGAAEWTIEALPPGRHRIIAVLGYGDHVPMTGVATDTVHIVVR